MILNRNSITDVAKAIDDSVSENDIRNLYRQLQMLVRKKINNIDDNEFSFLNGEYVSYSQGGISYFGRIRKVVTDQNSVKVKFDNLYSISTIDKHIEKDCIVDLQHELRSNTMLKLSSSDYCQKLQEWYDTKNAYETFKTLSIEI